MKTMTNARKFAFAGMAMTSLFLFAACGGGQQANKATQDDNLPKDSLVKEVTKYPLPTAFEVTNLLNKAGAGYILSISNTISNSDKYFTEKSKAINLGVYGADLAYASTYQMKQETMNYLKVSKKMIDELQISTEFNSTFADRVEKNIDSQDSLIKIISDSFYKTYEFLTSNGKDNLSLLVMSGSWVEGVYITSEIEKTSKNPQDIIKILQGQDASLVKLLDLLDKNKSNADIAEMQTKLQVVADAYKTIQGDKVDQKMLDKFGVVVEKLRNELIK
ncbi:MAG TPA: hypothetical protein VMV56_11080 [Williamwhitmania sp.]|nr:hypothetical protein [Williamwhitmania sp.]